MSFSVKDCFANFVKIISMSKSIADIRTDYMMHQFTEKDAAKNMYDQFTAWWNQAVASEIYEVNAMTLATIGLNGSPAARIVLLKGYDTNGFVFYTNYSSHKGLEMAANGKVSLLFFWKELERQIRIDGVVEKVEESESDEYFQSRPIGSRIGAWASPQSTVIENRETLEKNEAAFTKQFGEGPVPRPSHWGGYRVKPLMVEFWQGRMSRLHDRIRYQLQANGDWQIQRLAP